LSKTVAAQRKHERTTVKLLDADQVVVVIVVVVVVVVVVVGVVIK